MKRELGQETVDSPIEASKERRVTNSMNAARCPHVFQIGFNKCGTRTICEYFRANGVPAVHWKRGRLAQTIFANWLAGRNILRGLHKHRVFTDMESVGDGPILEAYKLFPWMAHDYPDAVFILNTRPLDHWLESRFNHMKGKYARRWRDALGLESYKELANAWTQSWHAHHDMVRAFFAPGRHRFFEFDIELEGPEAIGRQFPELDLDPAFYRVFGKTDQAIGRPALR